MESNVANINVNNLSLSELKQLHRDISKAIAGFEGRKKAEVIAALEAQAKELGFTLAELTGQQVTRKRSEAQPKYRHPENADITWSGRGRRPRWFIAALEAGTSPDLLAV